MKQLAFGALVALAFSSSANAQVVRYDPKTILAAAQCEIGLWAAKTNYRSSDPSRQRAGVKLEGSEVTSASGSVGFKFPFDFFPSAKAGGSSDQTQTWETGRPYNIHPANAQACARVRPDLKIVQCFSDNQDVFLQGYSFKCTRKTSAKANIGGDGKVRFWLIEAGPSVSTSIERSFNVTLTAPYVPPKPGAQ